MTQNKRDWLLYLSVIHLLGGPWAFKIPQAFDALAIEKLFAKAQGHISLEAFENCVAVIVDCFEMNIGRTSNLTAGKQNFLQTQAHRKVSHWHCTTGRYLSFPKSREVVSVTSM